MATIKTDADLIQIVDAALADATVRAGKHLVCRPGCSQCCVGSFAINMLDAVRLRRGWTELSIRDPERFHRLAQRVGASVASTSADFPGDVVSGLLDESLEGNARFEEFANAEVCPVLDPEEGTCDLYDYRPMTCRVFGPPVRSESSETGADGLPLSGLGVCELCFIGADPDEIAAAELVADPENVEWMLLQDLARTSGGMGTTTVAYALSTPSILKIEASRASAKRK